MTVSVGRGTRTATQQPRLGCSSGGAGHQFCNTNGMGTPGYGRTGERHHDLPGPQHRHDGPLPAGGGGRRGARRQDPRSGDARGVRELGSTRDRSALRRPRVDAGDDRSARPPTRRCICTAPLRRLVRPPPRRRGCDTGHPDLRRVPRPPPRARRRDAGLVRPDRGRRVRPDLLHRRGTPHPRAPRPGLDRASDLRVPRERPPRHGQHGDARTPRDHPRGDDPGRRPRRQRRTRTANSRRCRRSHWPARASR